jgi:hypothetical protein
MAQTTLQKIKNQQEKINEIIKERNLITQLHKATDFDYYKKTLLKYNKQILSYNIKLNTLMMKYIQE